MRFTIDTESLTKVGLSLKELLVLLYYKDKPFETFDSVCESLWNKGFLVKDVGSYYITPTKTIDIQCLCAEVSSTPKMLSRNEKLAIRMQEKFPEGKMPGTNYYWRDSPKVIASRLATFFKKFGDGYEDDDIVRVTEKYVKDYNAVYPMQLLKYFIFKVDKATGEIRSELLSYLTNKDAAPHNDSWVNELV